MVAVAVAVAAVAVAAAVALRCVWQHARRRFARKPREKWDAESIVSTYTNTENHPSVIKVPSRCAAWAVDAVAEIVACVGGRCGGRGRC